MQFIIVGNGVAGTEAALTIRRRYPSRDAKITLISDESDYFFSRTALMYAYMDRLNVEDMEPYERKVYETQAIRRVRDRVTDLDATRQEITLRSGKSLAYDKLLLATGSIPRSATWTGLKDIKDGLVNFVSLQDLQACERLTWTTKNAVVVGGGLIGVELAECFLYHKLDVTFLIREPYFWPMALGVEEGEMISQHMRDHGIRVVHDEEIQSVAADPQGRVASITTTKDNNFACQMLGVAIGVQPNCAWLHNATTAPQLNEGIIVDSAFETSLPNVYAAGDCAEIRLADDQAIIEQIWYSAKRQGELAARSMMGDAANYAPPLFYNSSKFFDIEYTTVGNVFPPPAGTRTLYRKMAEKHISQRLFYDQDERILGFNMLGSRWDHEILARWIEERRSLQFVREHLHVAQFDVEFGRAQLHKMDEKEVAL